MSSPIPENHHNNIAENIPLFETPVGIYGSTTDSTGREGTFKDFLLLGAKHRDTIERLRTLPDGEERTRLKKSLPLATLSGVFAPTRTNDNLKRHTGYICVDIDHADDPEEVKAKLMRFSCAAFASISVGGHGVFALMKIAYPDRHAEQWQALTDELATWGIFNDTATKNVSRTRIVSYDPSPLFRDDSKVIPFEGIYVAPKIERIAPVCRMDADEIERNVAYCCDKLGTVDITPGYNNWLYLGFALSSMGESGRQYFHAISQNNPAYNIRESDKRFTEYLRRPRRIGIDYFFDVCRQYGVDITEDTEPDTEPTQPCLRISHDAPEGIPTTDHDAPLLDDEMESAFIRNGYSEEEKDFLRRLIESAPDS